MATERLSMRQIREILRQKWGLGQSHRAVAESLGIGSGTVGTTVLRARAAGLEWAQVERLTDEVLEARVYGRPTLWRRLLRRPASENGRLRHGGGGQGRGDRHWRVPKGS